MIKERRVTTKKGVGIILTPTRYLSSNETKEGIDLSVIKWEDEEKNQIGPMGETHWLIPEGEWHDWIFDMVVEIIENLENLKTVPILGLVNGEVTILNK